MSPLDGKPFAAHACARAAAFTRSLAAEPFIDDEHRRWFEQLAVQLEEEERRLGEQLQRNLVIAELERQFDCQERDR